MQEEARRGSQRVDVSGSKEVMITYTILRQRQVTYRGSYVGSIREWLAAHVKFRFTLPGIFQNVRSVRYRSSSSKFRYLASLLVHEGRLALLHSPSNNMNEAVERIRMFS